MRTISEWQAEAHALAVEKGFYEGKDKLSPTFIGSRLALIHREISEATECVCTGDMDLFWVDRKPEGFPIELADVFIRLCDFAECVGVQMDEPDPKTFWEFTLDSPEAITCELNSLHMSLAAVTCVDPDARIDGYALSGFLGHLFYLARATNVDLLAMAELKHSYNITRPQKHGKVL